MICQCPSFTGRSVQELVSGLLDGAEHVLGGMLRQGV